MSTAPELFTIGQLARRTGLAARTIRFWSDAGLVPPAGRSANGYRLYDAAAVARLDLVRTLRELGFGLETTRAVLARATTFADVAAVHVDALDAEIRTLRVRRAVLSTVAKRGSSVEEALLMHNLAQLSAAERQRIIENFVAEVFEGIDPDRPAMGIASSMRRLPDLPDEPAPEQVDAWLELGELVADPGFRQRVRGMALAGDGTGEMSAGADYTAVITQAGRAIADGVDPASPEGKAVLDRIVDPGVPAVRRTSLLGQLETFTDARVERYWQLLAIIGGQGPPAPVVPVFEWLIAALRAWPEGSLSRSGR
jgi:DNA-binding transcriptional MerR regulator